MMNTLTNQMLIIIRHLKFKWQTIDTCHVCKNRIIAYVKKNGNLFI